MLTALEQLLHHENLAVLRETERSFKREEMRNYIKLLEKANRTFNIIEVRIQTRKDNLKYKKASVQLNFFDSSK